MTRVLLVESDQPLVRRLSWILEEAGFEVAAVRCPKDASSALATFAPSVVVMNESLPPEQMQEYAAMFVDRQPSLRVLDMSRQMEESRRTELKVDAYIKQPFDVDDFVVQVQDLVDRDPATLDDIPHDVDDATTRRSPVSPRPS